MRARTLIAASILTFAGAGEALAQRTIAPGPTILSDPRGGTSAAFYQGWTPNRAPVRQATLAELRVGETVRDRTGRYIGEIVASGAQGVVIRGGERQTSVPVSAFRIQRGGPVVTLGRSEFWRRAMRLQAR